MDARGYLDLLTQGYLQDLMEQHQRGEKMDSFGGKLIARPDDGQILEREMSRLYAVTYARKMKRWGAAPEFTVVGINLNPNGADDIMADAIKEFAIKVLTS